MIYYVSVSVDKEFIGNWKFFLDWKLEIKLENITLASNKVAQVIVKDKRPFTDDDFVQKCMMAVVETVCSKKIRSLRIIGRTFDF